MSKVVINKVNYPRLIGEDKRPSSEITNNQLKERLENEGQVFCSYAPRSGDIYRFPSLRDAIVREQLYPNGTYKLRVVGCMISTDDGMNWSPYWFPLNYLAKRNACNEPIYESWYRLGNVYRRLVGLCMLGEMKIGKDFQVSQLVFENGQPKLVQTKDENGQPKLDEFNNPIYVNVTRMITCCELPEAPYVPEDA